MHGDRLLVNHLRRELAERAIRVSTVSRETGISRSTLTGLYYGMSKFVSFSTLEKLCNYLDCDIADLLEMRDKSSPKSFPRHYGPIGESK